MKISVVFPIHNEYENLKPLLEDWSTKLKKILNISYEFILVEDGSTDGTKELISNLEKKYPIINLSSEKKRGYTKAVLEGIKSSTGEYILCTDSDNQIKVDSLIKNLDNLPEENVFLIGYRNPRKDSTNRIFYSKLFKALHIILFDTKLKDPSCPFVIGKRKTFNSLPTKLLNMMTEGFWWGFVATCLKTGKKIKETPIQHFERKSGVASYGITKLPGIIIRNVTGLIKIKYFKIDVQKDI